MRKARRTLRAGLLSKTWSVIITVIILYILFLDDVVYCIQPRRTDILLNAIGATKVAIFFLFVLEFILNLFANWRIDYNWKSVFFYLDILAILSLVPDLLGFFGGALLSRQIATLTIARAGRAARAAARLARLFRLAKLYDVFNKV